MSEETKPASTAPASSNSGGGKSFLLGLVVGIIIGAFAGVLLPEINRMGGGDVPAGDGSGVAPTSTERDPGLDTPSADDVGDAVEDAADDVQDAANDAIDAAGDAVDDAAGSITPPGDG